MTTTQNAATEIVARCYNPSNATVTATALPTTNGEGLPGSIALSAHLVGQFGGARRDQGRGYGEALLYNALPRGSDDRRCPVARRSLPTPSMRVVAWHRRVGFEPFPP